MLPDDMKPLPCEDQWKAFEIASAKYQQALDELDRIETLMQIEAVLQVDACPGPECNAAMRRSLRRVRQLGPARAAVEQARQARDAAGFNLITCIGQHKGRNIRVYY